MSLSETFLSSGRSEGLISSGGFGLFWAGGMSSLPSRDEERSPSYDENRVGQSELFPTSEFWLTFFEFLNPSLFFWFNQGPIYHLIIGLKRGSIRKIIISRTLITKWYKSLGEGFQGMVVLVSVECSAVGPCGLLPPPCGLLRRSVRPWLLECRGKVVLHGYFRTTG